MVMGEVHRATERGRSTLQVLPRITGSDCSAAAGVLAFIAVDDARAASPPTKCTVMRLVRVGVHQQRRRPPAASTARYCVGVADDDGVIGDDPLVNGMVLSLRLRRDFTVADADRLLATARRTYRALNPGSSAEEARKTLACAADALFILLEHAGLLGDTVDSRLAGYTTDGLTVGGWRAQVVLNEPDPLSPEPRRDCLRGGDVFALPPGGAD
jgi:hypothetical protein